ncbi:MAG: hypothetical protein WKG03_07950 [Telluria sp.]
MQTSNPIHTSRLDRELERERDERHKNDDAKSGGHSDQELRSKDARESTSSGHLNRTRR